MRINKFVFLNLTCLTAVQLVRFKYGSDVVVVDKRALQTRLGGVL